MPIPAEPKIYHIVHVDRLPSIITDGSLWSDAKVTRHSPSGTTIGMQKIKQRRLTVNKLDSHPDLFVGDCVPFYFCPRSIMLYLLHKANDPELIYRGGQAPIVHLEMDLRQVTTWAEQHGQRWAFTLSNAGNAYFEDRCDLKQLGEINWAAVQNNGWGYQGVSRSVREGKQAEFLVENQLPWNLVTRIGVHSQPIYNQVTSVLSSSAHKPSIEVKNEWYY